MCRFKDMTADLSNHHNNAYHKEVVAVAEDLLDGKQSWNRCKRTKKKTRRTSS